MNEKMGLRKIKIHIQNTKNASKIIEKLYNNMT